MNNTNNSTYKVNTDSSSTVTRRYNVMNNLGKSADEAMDIIGVKAGEREELKKCYRTRYYK